MKKILDFIVYSNLFIALCTALFTWQTLIIFSVDNSEAPGFIIINFISTFVLYNAQRLYYSAKLDFDKYSWYNANRRLMFTLILLLLLLSTNFIWHFFTENKKVLISYAILSALSLFYFLPPFQLRRFGMLKPFLISFIFVFTGILMPLDFLINVTSLFYMGGQFLFIALLCVLFDLRDREHDIETGVNTFPAKFGEKKTKLFIYFLLVIYLGLSLLVRSNVFLISIIITFVASWTLTFFSNSKRQNLYFAFLVDGMIILQAALVIF